VISQPEKILIIDDETAIRRLLSHSLDPSQYELLEAASGEEGLRLAATRPVSLVLLDLGLPDLEGVEVARQLREWTQVPIIVLSVREQEAEKIAALDAGADDYLTKPFSVGELQARIRAALRRCAKESEPQSLFRVGDLEIDLHGHLVRKGAQEIHLTPNEFKLLATLVRNAGRVVTHRQLLTDVWGLAFADEGHYLRVYMGQLRHKLEDDPAQPKLFVTESGVGYRLRFD
jgi:two-component system KDP operon response regulator KdpE